VFKALGVEQMIGGQPGSPVRRLLGIAGWRGGALSETQHRGGAAAGTGSEWGLKSAAAIRQAVGRGRGRPSGGFGLEIGPSRSGNRLELVLIGEVTVGGSRLARSA